MRYSVTGSHRELTEDEKTYIYLTMVELDDPTEITTGAASGVDTAAFYASVLAWPDKTRPYKRIVVPAAPHNVILVGSPTAAREDGAIIEYAEAGASKSESYMIRNDRLIHHAGGGALVAFPNTIHEEIRSGTWSTIRRAHRAGVTVIMRPLNLAALLPESVQEPA